jgi:hypothetical protein
MLISDKKDFYRRNKVSEKSYRFGERFWFLKIEKKKNV